MIGHELVIIIIIIIIIFLRVRVTIYTGFLSGDRNY
jgi:hypothetical protein